ncbi:DHHW family protein [Hespellia stercorisuis]|uniref:DHHW protein n=1 Tax=Hespellia stercorisuis DSM 15480 TaxID=1121950 RepID=A0A1M6QQF2_9FIRM|nr:DHHW family protein [Hespellia stercorisuis]SHK22257.1 DHHW protein [Hespellia stercorisuis DSM 15480]
MANKKKRKKIKIQAFLVKPFLICLGVFMIGNILLPTREYSEVENRSLAKRPRLTLSSLQTGTFMEQYEDYLMDQFIGRNLLRDLKVRIDTFAGNKEENGVYRGKQGQLMEDVVIPDQEVLKKNVKAIKEFAESNSGIPTSMILVPDAACILEDELPSLATVANQRTMIKSVKRELGESVSWVDAVSVLDTHKNEKVYYKTDHHWTTLGAYYVFQESGSALGVQSKEESTFSPYAVTTTFNGTLSSKSGYEENEKEEIDIYTPQGEDLDVVVNYVQEQKKTTSLYDSTKLDTKDKYAVFLGGNYSLLDIKTTVNAKRKLLMFKDSYANCFIPFLTPYFREIVVVDPRYYTGDVSELVGTYNITDCVFLYNANTFFADNNISGVLTGE